MTFHKTLGIVLAAYICLLASSASAALFRTYVTGEVGSSNVIFEVDFDPTDASKTSVGIAYTEARGYFLDGIDFVIGDTSKVVVGAQISGSPENGAITSYDIIAPGGLLPDLVPSTNAPGTGPAPTGPGSKPSSILTTATHHYYTENQFGFAPSTPDHRIMRTPGGDTVEIVFDGAAAAGTGIGSALINLEGLAIVPGVDLGSGPADRLYFFAEDDADPSKRALYSIALDGSGIFDGAHGDAGVKHLSGLEGPTDGADELDLDTSTGILYGSNIVNGEIILWDVPGGFGTPLISALDISTAPGGSSLKRMETARFDGIRVNGDGYLILTGQDGVIASVDIDGAMAGVGPEDVLILYDDLVEGNGYEFDDLTPSFLVPEGVPEPSSIMLLSLIMAFFAHKRRRRQA